MRSTRNRLVSRVKLYALNGALISAVVPWLLAPALCGASTDQDQLVDKAKLTAEAFAAEPGLKGAISEWSKDAKGLFIVPQLLKGAFIFGGAGGSGVLLVRDEKTRKWSEPAFYNIGAVSFGFQAGGDAEELVFVVRNQKGLEEFYRSDFKLGVDAGVSIGPAGGSSSVEGVAADILAYGRSKGAFAGAALNGAAIAVSNESNEVFYGKPVRPTDILVKHAVTNPKSADLRAAVVNLMK
jgi:lipid-binding SYLF domain-containing protein